MASGRGSFLPIVYCRRLADQTSLLLYLGWFLLWIDDTTVKNQMSNLQAAEDHECLILEIRHFETWKICPKSHGKSSQSLQTVSCILLLFIAIVSYLSPQNQQSDLREASSSQNHAFVKQIDLGISTIPCLSIMSV